MRDCGSSRSDVDPVNVNVHALKTVRWRLENFNNELIDGVKDSLHAVQTFEAVDRKSSLSRVR